MTEMTEITISFSYSASCPICNSRVEMQRRRRIFLNIDVEDVEHFLVNHPQIFADLVERHQDILDQPDQRNQMLIRSLDEMRTTIERMAQPDQRNQMLIRSVDEMRTTIERMNHRLFRTNARRLEIPHFNLAMRVDDEGMLFAPLQANSDDDENVENYDNDAEDVLELPTLRLGMHVNQHSITFSKLAPSDDEDDEDGEDGEDEEDVELADEDH